MQLPEMDGLALAREIRCYRDEGALPLVLLTSIGRLRDARGAPDFSAQLTKPVKASQLYEALVRILAGEPATEWTPRDAADASTSGTAELRLLVAEDNPVNRRLALALLGSLGYHADVVESGQEVIDALERRVYDVVLMDVQMPVLDGIEATRRIRGHSPPGAGPTIIAMTANAMQGDRDACLAAGMNDYLPKPIRIDELSRALARCHRVEDGRAESAPCPDDVVDRAALETLASALGGGDEGWEAVGALIDAFLEDAPTQIADIRDAIKRGDAIEVRRVAHALKSNGATFGAGRFSEQCQGLEALGRQGDLSGAPVVLERADQAWGHVTEALEAVRAGLDVQ
jgi:CheY-like chemotaxis protein